MDRADWQVSRDYHSLSISQFYGQHWKIVIPKDTDKILMRWKVSDNEYRVIFGDLYAETVTTEKLTELEKDLPKLQS